MFRITVVFVVAITLMVTFAITTRLLRQWRNVTAVPAWRDGVTVSPCLFFAVLTI